MSDPVLNLTLAFTENLQRLKGSPQGLPAEIAFWIPPVADRDSEAYFALEKPNWGSTQHSCYRPPFNFGFAGLLGFLRTLVLSGAASRFDTGAGRVRKYW